MTSPKAASPTATNKAGSALRNIVNRARNQVAGMAGKTGVVDKSASPGDAATNAEGPRPADDAGRATAAGRNETLRVQRARNRPQGQRAGVRPKLVLASGSPRRLALLAQVGIKPDALRPASIDETPGEGEPPRALVVRLARQKAEIARDRIAGVEKLADSYVLGADTIVAVGRRILVKPQFVDEAVACLQQLSGRSHRVLTAVHMITPDDKSRRRVVETRVRFKRLSTEEIDSYIASREWCDKAGGYAIQGLAGAFVRKITGSYPNVVGLPISDVVQMLVGEGFPVHFAWLRQGDVDE